jgi:hypothetical protein
LNYKKSFIISLSCKQTKQQPAVAAAAATATMVENVAKKKK